MSSTEGALPDRRVQDRGDHRRRARRNCPATISRRSASTCARISAQLSAANGTPDAAPACPVTRARHDREPDDRRRVQGLLAAIASGRSHSSSAVASIATAPSARTANRSANTSGATPPQADPRVAPAGRRRSASPPRGPRRTRTWWPTSCAISTSHHGLLDDPRRQPDQRHRQHAAASPRAGDRAPAASAAASAARGRRRERRLDVRERQRQLRGELPGVLHAGPDQLVGRPEGRREPRALALAEALREQAGQAIHDRQVPLDPAGRREAALVRRDLGLRARRRASIPRSTSPQRAICEVCGPPACHRPSHASTSAATRLSSLRTRSRRSARKAPAVIVSARLSRRALDGGA